MADPLLLGAVLVLLALPDATVAPVPAPAPTLAPQQGSLEQDPTAAAPVDPRTRVRERILHLSGGQVLRGKARWVGEHWEIEGSQGSLALPPGAVVADRLESEVLAEARGRLARVRRGDLGARVEVADWLLREGLLGEGLEQLDQVLLADPEHAAAHELLDREDLPVAVPAWGDEGGEDRRAARAVLLDYGARAGPALQELVVAQLVGAGAADRAGLLSDLEDALIARSEGRRAFAALALRRLFPGEGTARLLRRAVLDPAQLVRARAGWALAQAGDPSLTIPLIELLGHESSVVRTHAAEALGLLAQPAAVPALAVQLASLVPASGEGVAGGRGSVFFGRQVSYVAGFEAEVAQSAAVAHPVVGVVQEGAALDVRVLGVGGGTAYSFTTETKALRAALARLTGASVQDSNAAWKRWWRGESERWVVEHLADPPAAAHEAGG